MLALKDVPTGSIAYTSERIGDAKNSMEVREVFYLREPDRSCKFASNVPIARLGIAQGTGGSPPRYSVKLASPCRDPGEVDGRIMVQLLSSGGSLWASHLDIR